MELIKPNGAPLVSAVSNIIQPSRLRMGEILNYHEQIQRWRQTKDVNYYFDSYKINEFYTQYEKKIKEGHSLISEIRKKFFEHDEKGNVIYEPAEPKINSNQKLKEGMTREDYQKEINTMMGMTV